MNHSHFNILSRELRKLLAAGLNDSAEILAQLYLSSAGSSSGAIIPNAGISKSKDSHLLSVIESFELIGDALRAKREVKRALNYYRMAGQQKKFVKAASSASKASNSEQSQDFSSHINGDRYELSLILKECQCLIDMKDSSAALTVLETVPQRQRDLRYYIMSGDLYLESNLKEKAKISFKEALSLCPFAIEIIKKLIVLGIDDGTLIHIVNQTCKDEDFQVLMEHDRWYEQLISIIFYVRTYQVQKSIHAIPKLLGVFPKNIFLLTMAIQIYAENDMMEQSLAYFQQLRRTDATVIDDMDKIAFMLFQHKEEIELGRLANDVITCQPNRPEGYNIAALYSALKEEYNHALAFVEKVICS
jgi:tetratricopeptide (TPR) repeat protein